MSNDRVPEKPKDPSFGVSEPARKECLEIYKIHVDIADRWSQRRWGATRLYFSLFTGLVALFAALFRSAVEDIKNTEDTLSGMGLRAVVVAGVWVAFCWWSTIRSYLDVDADKRRVLDCLEQRLTFRFFASERKRAQERTQEQAWRWWRWWEWSPAPARVEMVPPTLALMISVVGLLLWLVLVAVLCACPAD